MKNHNHSLCHSERSEESIISVVIASEAKQSQYSECHPELVSGSLHRHCEQSEKSHTRGFALLLTLVVVSVIGVVAFGVGRLTLTEFRQTMRFQDSQNALQAAEAGIEDGLVRFRYDRNVEVPYGAKDTCTSSVTEPTTATSYVLRVNLSNGVRSCIDPTKTPSPDPSQNVYDLKIMYKSTKLGAFGSTPTQLLADANTPTLNQDQLLVISGLDGTANGVIVQYAFVPGTFKANSSGYQAEIKFLDKNGNQVGDTRIIHFSSEIANITSGSGLNIPLASGTNEFTIKLLEGDVKVAAVTTGSLANQAIDYGITMIESTGYSNGVKRKLVNLMNRKSGNAQSLYNFVLYGGSINPITAP